MTKKDGMTGVDLGLGGITFGSEETEEFEVDLLIKGLGDDGEGIPFVALGPNKLSSKV